jgi:hypothetical protein
MIWYVLESLKTNDTVRTALVIDDQYYDLEQTANHSHPRLTGQA